MDLDETVFQDFSRPSHPLPSLVGIYPSIGFQTNSAPGELDDDTRDIPSILICVSQHNDHTKLAIWSILTSIPQCTLP